MPIFASKNRRSRTRQADVETPKFARLATHRSPFKNVIAASCHTSFDRPHTPIEHTDYLVRRRRFFARCMQPSASLRPTADALTRKDDRPGPMAGCPIAAQIRNVAHDGRPARSTGREGSLKSPETKEAPHQTIRASTRRSPLCHDLCALRAPDTGRSVPSTLTASKQQQPRRRRRSATCCSDEAPRETGVSSHA